MVPAEDQDPDDPEHHSHPPTQSIPFGGLRRTAPSQQTRQPTGKHRRYACVFEHRTKWNVVTPGRPDDAGDGGVSSQQKRYDIVVDWEGVLTVTKMTVVVNGERMCTVDGGSCFCGKGDDKAQCKVWGDDRSVPNEPAGPSSPPLLPLLGPRLKFHLNGWPFVLTPTHENGTLAVILLSRGPKNEKKRFHNHDVANKRQE